MLWNEIYVYIDNMLSTNKMCVYKFPTWAWLDNNLYAFLQISTAVYISYLNNMHPLGFLSFYLYILPSYSRVILLMAYRCASATVIDLYIFVSNYVYVWLDYQMYIFMMEGMYIFIFIYLQLLIFVRMAIYTYKGIWTYILLQ